MISIGKPTTFVAIKLMLMLSLTVVAEARPSRDTTSVADSSSRYVFIVTPRINSAGHFPFTGSLINRNLNGDINIFYSRRTLGFFIFKSYDLVDSHSAVHYFQPGVFLNIPIQSTFKLRTVFGYLFSQTTEFRDADSDYYAALALYWDVTPRVKIEHTALWYDCTINSKLANRFLVSWESKKIRIDLYVWHRLVIGEQTQALSSSLAITYPKIKINKNVSLHLTTSYLGYLTNAKPDFALRDGFLLTMAVPVRMN